jgi:hypothetical protein
LPLPLDSIAMQADTTINRDTDLQLKQWQAFLQSYSQGDFPANQTPTSPPVPSVDRGKERPFTFQEYEKAPVYVHSEIDLETASRVREFYARHGFLPPPRGSGESAREQCVEEYDLYSADQARSGPSIPDVKYGLTCSEGFLPYTD